MKSRLKFVTWAMLGISNRISTIKTKSVIVRSLEQRGPKFVSNYTRGVRNRESLKPHYCKSL
jgi:hypothetical protein